MKADYKMALSAVVYFIAFVSLVCLLGTDFTDVSFTHFDKLIASLMFFGSAALGTRFLCIGRDYSFCRSAIKATVAVMLVVYFMVVVDFTLIDDTFGRRLSSIFTCGSERLSDYVENSLNLVPFRTVRLFINSLRHGLLEPFTVAENLVGNFCVFMPFALLVPMCFRRVDGALKLFAAVSGFVIVIEVLQLVFMTGCADIDDYILNVSGCMAAYGVFRIKRVDRTLNRLSYGMWKNRE